jgi:hypothetical protein
MQLKLAVTSGYIADEREHLYLLVDRDLLLVSLLSLEKAEHRIGFRQILAIQLAQYKPTRQCVESVHHKSKGKRSEPCSLHFALCAVRYAGVLSPGVSDGAEKGVFALA